MSSTLKYNPLDVVKERYANCNDNWNKGTEAAKRRYSRIAPVHDIMDGLVERSRCSKWRKIQWNKVEGSNILEVGVGTGKNFPHYPAETEIIAIDLSEKMLKYARDKARKQGVQMHLQQMDA